MSNLVTKGLYLLHKLEEVYAEVRKQENSALLLVKQRELNEALVAPQDVAVGEDVHNSDECDAWNTTCELLSKENKELKSRNEKLSLQCRSKESSNLQLVDKVKKLTAAIEALQKEKDEQTNEWLHKWSDVLKIDNLLKSIARETEMYKSAVSKIQELFAQQENEVRELRYERNSALNRIESLSTRCGALNLRNESLATKIDVLSVENSDLKVRQACLQSETTSCINALQEKTSRIRELETQCKALQAEVNQERTLREAQQATVTELQKQSEKNFADFFSAYQANQELSTR